MLIGVLERQLMTCMRSILVSVRSIKNLKGKYSGCLQNKVLTVSNNKGGWPSSDLQKLHTILNSISFTEHQVPNEAIVREKKNRAT